MTPEAFRNLERGDIVNNNASRQAWMVDANYGDRVTLVCTMDAQNPAEWDLVVKVVHVPLPLEEGS